jgi:DNA modification methylase
MIMLGDCLAVLPTLEAESVQCVVTSPPYWGLRDYGCAGQLGLERTPEEYVEKLVAVFREVRRVLKGDGTVWLNLGDSYAGSGPSGASYRSETTKRREGMDTDGAFRISKTLGDRGLTYAEKKPIPPPGLKSKDLVGIPWRVAFALQADGWYLRSDIIWSKPNPMPESVQGSHYSRHRVTIAEYENLSGLRYACECAGDDWAGDMPSLSEREVLSRQAPLSAERPGAVYGPAARGTCRCQSQASGVLCVTTGAYQQREISADKQGAGGRPETVGKLSRKTSGSGGDGDGAGLDRHSGTASPSLLLLQEEDYADDAGPCDSFEQGRTELAGECGSGVSVVQLRQEGQTDPPLLVGCPGCQKCLDHHGYTFHLSAGRPTKAHEYLFLLSKSERYYYDAAAIAEPSQTDPRENYPARARIIGRGGLESLEQGATPQQRSSGGFPPRSDRKGDSSPRNDGNEWNSNNGRGFPFNGATRNRRTVWTINTQPFPGAHFAVMPEALVEPCIKAGSKPGDVVLDPFAGAGTVGAVCERYDRRFIGIELNPAYVAMAEQRIAEQVRPLFTESDGAA